MSDAELSEVEEANLRFYRAFETLDMSRMDAVWLHTERAPEGWRMIHHHASHVLGSADRV